MIKKYICVHGHFYQPPRENAWLEEIEYQDSAAPYHDWNERITAECYAPNAVSRILDENKRIVDIVNNYSRMSFNFGPTLLSWLEEHRPKTYERILAADKRSIERFGGHGSAIAQVYNHIIMPLASRRDKDSQVYWGLRDFENRFGRNADGMWLAETAVDTETLEVLAEQGVKYTILAPRQAKRFKELGAENWTNGIDPRVPYLCKLPSGNSIKLFFYDGDRSQAVAFKGLLKDGKEFAQYLMGGFDDRSSSQLVHIATDGESYGHHHHHGDMALAFCIRSIETNNLATITNYGQYLELNPPRHLVEIHENSSWSCVHGVERWKANCGCNSGGQPGWNQEWRAPLRASLDWLRDQLAAVFEKQIGALAKDPWKIRNLYVEVVLDHTQAQIDKFLLQHFGKVSDRDRTHILRLLEMQRHSLLMFTSCGWFFDEISGIETVQILQYAARAIQLAESESSVLLEDEFKERLAVSKSNMPEFETGADVYEKYVVPSRLTLTQIGMHYAVTSLFAENPDDILVFNYTCKSTDFRRLVQANQRLALGRTHVRSQVTNSEKHFSYVVLYLGQHHCIGKAFEQIPLEEYHVFVDEVVRAFQDSNISKIFELFRRYPDQRDFSFFDMFKDEQIKMLNGVLAYGIDSANSSYRKINERNYNLLNVMRATNLEPPALLVRNLETVLNIDLRSHFANGLGKVNIESLRAVTDEICKWNFTVDVDQVSFICAGKLDKMLLELDTLTNGHSDRSGDLIENIHQSLVLLERVKVIPELNAIQDVIFSHLKHVQPDIPQALFDTLIQFAEYINLDTAAVEARLGKVGAS